MLDSRIHGPLPDDAPPDPGLRVLVPYVRKPLYLTILSERIVSVMTHWMTPLEHPPSGRLVRCDGGQCEHHRAGRPTRWAGFIACWEHVLAAPCVVKMTWNGAHILLKMFPDGKPLRGRQVECERMGESNKNPIWWKHGTRRHLDPVPDCPDILPVLASLYGPEVLEQLRQRAEEQP